MKLKMLSALLLLSFGVLFTACEQDTDFESDSPISIETRKAINTSPYDAAECKLPKQGTCNCEYQIHSIANPNANWQLYTYGASWQCCTNGNYFPYLDLDKTNAPSLYTWKNFDCELQKGQLFYFKFESPGANNITVKMRCGENEEYFTLNANSNNDHQPIYMKTDCSFPL